MPLAVGVAFKRVAKSYWFDPGTLELKDFDRVVVETARGLEIGTVRVTPREILESELQAPLKRVLRMADAQDVQQETANKERARHWYARANELGHPEANGRLKLLAN